jgi:hypothetical protein
MTLQVASEGSPIGMPRSAASAKGRLSVPTPVLKIPRSLGNAGRMIGLPPTSGADQILVEQSDVGLDAHRHPGVDPGLEFEQQIDIKPARSPAHPPNEVVSAVARVIADIAAAAFL